jgi:flagellar hook-associated protein 1 FlgK
MTSFNIGLSGLNLAQSGLNLVGTNIANASTVGYHTQDMEVEPVGYGSGSTASIGGARVTGYSRTIDSLLESQILGQQPASSQVNQELSTLQSLQNAMGDTTTGGLSGAINTFFNSISQAASQPGSAAMSQQVVQDADTMASQFNQLGQFIDNLQQQIEVQAKQVAGQVNGL